jgi:hypothetical protein
MRHVVIALLALAPACRNVDQVKDAGADAGTDSDADSGTGADAGSDAGLDAGVDAGGDADASPGCGPRLLLDVDFDDMPVGGFPDGGWTCESEDAAEVTDHAAVSAPNSLGIATAFGVPPPAAGKRYIWQEIAAHPLPSTDCGVIWIEAEAMSLDIAGQTDAKLCLDTHDPDYAGNICVGDQSPALEWRSLSLRVDLASHAVTRFVDGLVVLPGKVYDPPPTSLWLEVEGISNGTLNSSGGLFDDVRVYDDGWGG